MDPLGWPPATISGRYSDPEARFRVLYGASEREAAFLETIQIYRPSLTDLALVQTMASAAHELPVKDFGVVPGDYVERRRIAAFRLVPGPRVLDLRSVETHAVLRTLLATELLAAGYSGAFNFGEIIGSDYVVTRHIARWAFNQGYGGIVYPSTHNHALSCWALFDSVEVIPIGAPEVIRWDDVDLVAAARLFGLTLPGR